MHHDNKQKNIFKSQRSTFFKADILKINSFFVKADVAISKSLLYLDQGPYYRNFLACNYNESFFRGSTEQNET